MNTPSPASRKDDSAPVIRVDSATPEPDGRTYARLRAGDLVSARDLHAKLAHGLALPDHYGNNFDALLDVLTDADVVAGRRLVIVVERAARACEIATHNLSLLTDVVQEAARRWSPEPSPVSLVLVEPPRAPPFTPDADAFAEEWVAAWNALDLERVLAHYADDVVMTSPLAARVVPASHGIIHGKAALRRYWRDALAAATGLHFTLDATLATVGGMTILYRNHRAERVSETLLFDADGLVSRAIVAYRAA